MYGLDINFLNDRPEYRPEPIERRRRTGGVSPGDRRVTLLGLVVGLALIGLTGGAWLFLQAQNAQLAERQADLDAQLGALKAKQAQLAGIVAQTRQINDETAALTSVFSSIKPWSATFTDVSSRTPPKVRILKIEEKAAAPGQRPSPSPSPSPSASPTPGAAPLPPQVPPNVIEISGSATTFNDVNDFLLVLQKSKFLKPEETKILAAKLGQPRTIQSLRLGENQGADTSKIKLSPEVAFTIQTALTDVPASELLQELQSKNAIGLVTRIETLQQKGVVKP